MNPDFRPKFVRSFWDGADSIREAVGRFDDAIKNGTFPAGEESYQ